MNPFVQRDPLAENYLMLTSAGYVACSTSVVRECVCACSQERCDSSKAGCTMRCATLAPQFCTLCSSRYAELTEKQVYKFVTSYISQSCKYIKIDVNQQSMSQFSRLGTLPERPMLEIEC